MYYIKIKQVYLLTQLNFIISRYIGFKCVDVIGQLILLYNTC